jgi:hypothetical protein
MVRKPAQMQLDTRNASLLLSGVISIGPALSGAASPYQGDPERRSSGPQAKLVTISASRSTVVYGGRVLLSGGVANRQADQAVSVLMKQYGDHSFSTVALVSTETGGGWRYTAEPVIETSFRAQSAEGTSASLAVHVRPRVSLSLRKGIFVTAVVGAHSFEGKTVFLQRRVGGSWFSIRKARLSRQPRRFRADLPHGSSRVRVLIPQREAGAGYLAGFSRVLLVHR